MRPSHLYNGGLYTSKTVSLYWDGPQVTIHSIKQWWHKSTALNESRGISELRQLSKTGDDPVQCHISTSPDQDEMYIYMYIWFYDQLHM